MKKTTLFIAALALTGITFGQATDIPLDFEATSDAYAAGVFGGLEGMVIDNPDVDGANTSARVFQAVKPVGSEVFAGVSFGQSTPVDFSQTQIINLTVWAPEANTKFTVKVEDAAGNDGPFIQLDAFTAGAQQWEVLAYDFSTLYNAATDYVNVAIFPNLNDAGDGATYYFDNLILDTTAGVEENLIGLSAYPNPVSSELNISAKSALQQVTVYNLLGQTVSVQAAEGLSTSVDVQALPAGTYIAQVQTAQGTTSTRFIKQ